MLSIEELAKKYETSLNSIAFVFNQTCNRRCLYCNSKATFSTRRYVDRDVINLANEYFPYIYEQAKSKGFEINLGGGEPGLMPDDVLDLVLKNEIDGIFSNGTIFHTDSFKKNYHNVKRVTYHIAPDIREDLFVKEVNIPGVEIIYLIIVHKLNIHIIKPFMKLNSHLNFDVTVNHSLFTDTIGHLRSRLTKEDLPKIYEEVKDIDNIIPVFKERLFNSFNRQLNSNDEMKLEVKRLCREKSHTVIDFTSNSTIPCKSCYKKYHSYKITKENIDFILNTSKSDLVDFDKHCVPCKIYLDSMESSL